VQPIKRLCAIAHKALSLNSALASNRSAVVFRQKISESISRLSCLFEKRRRACRSNSTFAAITCEVSCIELTHAEGFPSSSGLLHSSVNRIATLIHVAHCRASWPVERREAISDKRVIDLREARSRAKLNRINRIN